MAMRIFAETPGPSNPEAAWSSNTLWNAAVFAKSMRSVLPPSLAAHAASAKNKKTSPLRALKIFL
jgi:hypothetical protein